MTLDGDIVKQSRVKLQYEELKYKLVGAQNNNEEFITTFFLFEENKKRFDKKGYRVVVNGGMCKIYLLK